MQDKKWTGSDLRAIRGKTHSGHTGIHFLCTGKVGFNVPQMYKKALDVMFTQMSAKTGIKKHGEVAVAAMVKEFMQLDKGAMKGKPVVVP